MDDTKDTVTVLNALYDDSHRKEVIDSVDVPFLALELMVEAVEALNPVGRAEVDEFGINEALLENFSLTFKNLLSLAGATLKYLPDMDGFVWVDVGEGEVFKFFTDFPHPETVSDRDVDFEGFASDAELFFGRDVVKGFEIMEAVNELNDKDANILTRCDKELSQTFVMTVGAVIAHRAELCHTVDKEEDFITELFLNISGGDNGVFDGVVEEAGSNGLRLHAHSGKFEADRGNVHHVWLTRVALMPFVSFFGKCVRTLNELLISFSDVSDLSDDFVRADYHKVIVGTNSKSDK
jgi:hypothetical protein